MKGKRKKHSLTLKPQPIRAQSCMPAPCWHTYMSALPCHRLCRGGECADLPACPLATPESIHVGYCRPSSDPGSPFRVHCRLNPFGMGFSQSIDGYLLLHQLQFPIALRRHKTCRCDNWDDTDLPASPGISLLVWPLDKYYRVLHAKKTIWFEKSTFQLTVESIPGLVPIVNEGKNAVMGDPRVSDVSTATSPSSVNRLLQSGGVTRHKLAMPRHHLHARIPTQAQ
jgi:hypothetical protein